MSTAVENNDSLTKLDWERNKTTLAMFSTLVQSGIPPAQAIVESGITQPGGPEGLEPFLEKLWFERILHPDAEIFDGDLDPNTRKPGEITKNELYLLVDMMLYGRDMPMAYIASSLHIPAIAVGRIKKEIAEANYRIIDNHGAEVFVGDFMRRAENLLSRSRYNEGKVAPGHQNRLNNQKFQFEISNKILDRMQELGKIPKNLGTAHIEEEFIVEVRAGGVVSNRRKEIASTATDSDQPIDVISCPVPSQLTPSSREPERVDGAEPAVSPIRFVSEDQMQRLASEVAQTAEFIDEKLKQIASTPEGAAHLAQRLKDLGDKGSQNIVVERPDDM
jgi:hypothetical protein